MNDVVKHLRDALGSDTSEAACEAVCPSVLATIPGGSLAAPLLCKPACVELVFTLFFREVICLCHSLSVVSCVVLTFISTLSLLLCRHLRCRSKQHLYSYLCQSLRSVVFMVVVKYVYINTLYIWHNHVVNGFLVEVNETIKGKY